MPDSKSHSYLSILLDDDIRFSTEPSCSSYQHAAVVEQNIDAPLSLYFEGIDVNVYEIKYGLDYNELFSLSNDTRDSDDIFSPYEALMYSACIDSPVVGPDLSQICTSVQACGMDMFNAVMQEFDPR